MPEFTEDHRDTLKKLEVDMYFGESIDNPSVTTRLDRIERSMATLIRVVWILLTACLVSLMTAIIGKVHFQ